MHRLLFGTDKCSRGRVCYRCSEDHQYRALSILWRRIPCPIVAKEKQTFPDCSQL